METPLQFSMQFVMMWAGSLLLLGYIYFVLCDEEEKQLSPIEWKGGLTKMDETGHKVFNGLSTRAQIFGNTAFLCNPRLKPDVKATLLKLDMFPNDGEQDSWIVPFPDGKFQTEGNCECLQSIVDLTLDHEGTLWVLDVGAAFAPHSKSTPRCSPKVVGFNIHTGEVVKVIDLSNLITPTTRLQFIVTDFSEDGHRFIYVADAGSRAIIAFDVENDKGVRIILPDNVVEDFKPRDVLYLVLINKQSGRNLLYFTYRSGDNLFCIETKHLQEDEDASKAWNVGKKPPKMVILGTDEWESMYFRYNDESNVYKWNTTEVFTENNFRLVHRNINSNLTQTHAMPDYKRGVMRMVESNLVEYLDHSTPKDSINRLTVMAIPA